jgi:hypothetical protein
MQTDWAEKQVRKSYRTVKCGTHDTEIKQAKETYDRHREKRKL